jgi:hypothetical protein
MNLFSLFAVLLMVTQAPVPATRQAPNHSAGKRYAAHEHTNTNQTKPANPAAIPQPPESGHPKGEGNSSHEANNENSVTITEVSAVPNKRDWLDYLTLFIGMVLAVITGAGVVAAWRGLPELKKQAVAARDAALASRDAADISRLSLVSGDRAFVSVQQIRWLSHLNPAEDRYDWRIRVFWINNGKTPTRHLRVKTAILVQDSPLEEDFLFPLHSEGIETHPLITPGGTIESLPGQISGDDLALVQEGHKHLYIYGVSRYFDVFPNTKEHVTKFCNRATNVTGNPRRGYDSSTNIVGIDFVLYHRHNCADEDCQNAN